MADGTTAEPCAPQVMKAGWRTSQGRHRPGVTLQTQLARVTAHHHAGVRGAVWFVAGSAGLHFYRRMFEGERSALIGVALEANQFIRRNARHLCRWELPVWVVAIDARDGAFLQLVAEGPVESGSNIDVARRAQRINLLVEQRTVWRGVHLMARRAIDIIARVLAEGPYLLPCIAAVTLETGLVDSVRLRVLIVEETCGVEATHVREPRPVARFAGDLVRCPSRRFFDEPVRILTETEGLFFVANGASLRADVASRLSVGGQGQEHA